LFQALSSSVQINNNILITNVNQQLKTQINPQEFINVIDDDIESISDDANEITLQSIQNMSFWLINDWFIFFSKHALLIYRRT
jgi:hypothetical protein